MTHIPIDWVLQMMKCLCQQMTAAAAPHLARLQIEPDADKRAAIRQSLRAAAMAAGMNPVPDPAWPAEMQAEFSAIAREHAAVIMQNMDAP